MVIGKIKPTATIVAQFAAGVEIEAIQHEGKMFLPVVGMGEFSSPTPTEKDDAPRSEKPKSSEPAEEKPASKKEAAKYTKDDLIEMDVKELKKILTGYGVDPDDFDGKNTNKKLRDLILDAQAGKLKGNDDDDDNDEEEEKPKKSSKKEEPEEDDETVGKIISIIEDFDAGKKNKKKALSAILALTDDEDVDGDAIGDLLSSFEDDGEANIDELAEEIAAILSGEKPSKKAPAKKGKKKDDDEELVSVEDLEEGDRVSVWWDDENKSWYDGEVKSISKKGKVTIAYDDDTEEVIDPEVHTKIKRLAE